MAKLTIHEKVDRVMRLLIGLRKRTVASALAAHGFTAKDIAEGFRLLQALTVSDVADAGDEPDGSERMRKIDAWVHRWFPIAHAALSRRHSEVAARLFPKLVGMERTAHQSGEAMLFRMSYDALPPDDAAVALLSTRGLTPAVMEELRTLLDANFNAKPRTEWPPQDYTEAETKLWEWYLEWSAIVRARVKDKRVLRELGFGGDGADRSTSGAVAGK